MRVLDKNLPIWESSLDDSDPTNRLDNNWYSPSAYFAELQISKLGRSSKYNLMTMKELCSIGGIKIGIIPEADGQIGLVEGKNLRANYILPVFTAFSVNPMDVQINDLLISRTGEPGTAAAVTEPLLDYCPLLAVGNHTYHLHLKQEYQELAPFISAFLNSRVGQALARRRIAGALVGAIRKPDISDIPIPIPVDRKCPPNIRTSIMETQKRIIEAIHSLGPSENMAAELGIKEIDVCLPLNWAGGEMKHSSRLLR